MFTKLYPNIREVFASKFKRLRSLMFTKVDAYQDDVKSLAQLSFLGKFNVEGVTRLKKLISNFPANEIIPFLLELNSVYAINS